MTVGPFLFACCDYSVSQSIDVVVQSFFHPVLTLSGGQVVKVLKLTLVFSKCQVEGPTTYEESVEVMMIALRQLCEHRQREHTHVSEGARPSKQEVRVDVVSLCI